MTPYICVGTIVKVREKNQEGKVIEIRKSQAVVRCPKSIWAGSTKMLEVVSYREVE